MHRIRSDTGSTMELSSIDNMGGALGTSLIRSSRMTTCTMLVAAISLLAFCPSAETFRFWLIVCLRCVCRLHAWYGERESASHHDGHECNACQFSYVSVLYCVCISSYFCVCVLVCSCTCKGTRNYVIHVIDSSSDDLHLRDMDQWFFFFPRPAACAAVWSVRDSKSWRISSRTCASSDGTS